MEITDKTTGATKHRSESKSAALVLSHWAVVFFAGDVIALTVTALLNRDLPLPLMAIFAATVPVLFATAGLYAGRLRVSTLDHAPSAIGAITLAAMGMVTINFMVLDLSLDPTAVVRLWATAAVLMPAARILAGPVHRIAAQAVPKRRTLIVGSGHSAVLTAEKIERHPELGLEVVGFVDDGPRESVRGRHEPLLGDLDSLGDTIVKSEADVAVLAFVKNNYRQILSALYRSEPKVDILIMPRYYEFLSAGIQVDDLAGMPMLRMNKKMHSWAQAAFKRGEDLVFGGLLFLAVLPLFPLVALAIKLDSPGSVFYRSRRIGRDFKPFTIYKFRSMKTDADCDAETEERLREANPQALKMAVADPRVTRVGRIMRKTSIDELPQLFNVVRGDMSLVGPRPLHPDETAAYDEWQKKTLSVRPGITCIWQVSGRSDLPFDEKVWLDFMYIDTWSPWLDFRILLQTVIAVLSTRGAY